MEQLRKRLLNRRAVFVALLALVLCALAVREFGDMFMSYSSIPDTKKHIELVAFQLDLFAKWLRDRAEIHDASKLVSPEVEMFDRFRPKLDTMAIDSAEYKQALVEMGEALQHHYRHNSHHPEHFENGVSGMNLLDLVEMVCDWCAAAQKKKERVNMKWARERFKIEPQLESIVVNTLKLLE